MAVLKLCVTYAVFINMPTFQQITCSTWTVFTVLFQSCQYMFEMNDYYIKSIELTLVHQELK